MDFTGTYKAQGPLNVAQVMVMAFCGLGINPDPQAGRAPHANRPTPPRPRFKRSKFNRVIRH